MYKKISCYDEKLNVVEDFVAEEIVVSVFGNGKQLTNLRCSPQNLRELGAGHVVCEGLASEVNRVEVNENKIYVEYSEGERKIVESEASLNEIVELIDLLSNSPVWKLTGGTHSVAVKGKKIRVYEDVSRSCAFDKAVGSAVLDKDKIDAIAVSCRLSEIIVKKAINCGVSIVASKAAATSLAIELAKKYNITLIGFVRDNRAKIYTHPERITKFK